MLLREYLRMIYIYHIQKKTYKFLDSIVIYLDSIHDTSNNIVNKQVYKVLLRYDERHKSALRKLNIRSPYKFVSNPQEAIIDDDLIKNDKHDRLTIIYNKKAEISNVVVGENYKIKYEGE